VGRVKDKVANVLGGRGLPDSGAISLDQIHVEAGGTSGTNCSINDADIRGLIGKNANTTMSFSEWYGASNIITKGIVYHDTWNNDTPTGNRVNLASKINNNSTTTFEQRKGTTYGQYCFAHNEEFAKGIGSVTAVRKCNVYGAYQYKDAWLNFAWSSYSTIVDPLGNTSAYGRNNERIDSFTTPPKNMLSRYGATQCGNWIKDGMYLRHTWTLGDAPWQDQKGAKLFYLYVDLDFDFIPA